MVKIEQITSKISLGRLDMGLFALDHQGFEKRTLENKGARFLLSEMLKSNEFEVVYDEFNKPYLKGSAKKISISHSHNWLVVALSNEEEIGVDIELVRDKVERIKHKFATDDELKFAGQDHQKLTFLWAAKEAVYKAYGKKAVDFKDICIDAFDVNSSNTTKGVLHLKNESKTFELLLKEYEDYVLALTLHEF